MQSFKEAYDARVPPQAVSAVSSAFSDGSILEMLYDPDQHKTQFAYWRDGTWGFEEYHSLNPIQRLVPYSPNNNLIRNEFVRLPSMPQDYGTEAELVAAVRAFIHQYVDVSPLFEKLATYYVLFSWLFDGFNELPYLRVRGDPGAGKTRFLLTVGSICYKPIFASGASSISPLFRLLESFRGTLVIDEGDFRFSDSKAEIVKILNNGNVRGIPVLRSEKTSKGEFDPRAYQVFGPKIVATRGDFEDKALESRFLTEDMGNVRLREDVPINLPPEHKIESLALRNKLLLFRFRNFNKRPTLAHLVDRRLEPRINQIFVPLLSIIEDENARLELRAVAHQCQREMVSQRGLGTEAQVLEIMQELVTLSPDQPITIKEITERFTEVYGGDYAKKITPRWIGFYVNQRLHLKEQRTREGYVVPVSEKSKVERLFEKYGLSDAAPGKPETASVPAETFTRSPDAEKSKP